MIRSFGVLIGIVALPALLSVAAAQSPFSGAREFSVTLAREPKAETCIASQYGLRDGYHGRRTASGERFDTFRLTAAHRSRAFGSMVTVTNAATGRSVTVRITDRGPFIKGRCIDLSHAAAKAIGMGDLALVSLR